MYTISAIDFYNQFPDVTTYPTVKFLCEQFSDILTQFKQAGVHAQFYEYNRDDSFNHQSWVRIPALLKYRDMEIESNFILLLYDGEPEKRLWETRGNGERIILSSSKKGNGWEELSILEYLQS